jgi:hypothetical protein
MLWSWPLDHTIKLICELHGYEILKCYKVQWLWLALSKGPNRVGVPLTWGRKQIQFPKRRVFIFKFFRIRTMDEVRKPFNSMCYTPSSEPYKTYLLHVSFLFGFFFDPEDWGDMFTRNVGWLSVGYTALCARGQSSSSTSLITGKENTLSWQPEDSYYTNPL